MEQRCFSNILEVRVLPPEYIAAMKLASLRLYKYDISDVIGIIMSEKISREKIEKAVSDLYGDIKNINQSEKAVRLLDNIYKTENLEELYQETRVDEINNKAVLKSIQENNPESLKKDSIANILEAAKRKKEEQKESK